MDQLLNWRDWAHRVAHLGGLPELVTTFENGDMVGFAPLTEDDIVPEGFDGIRVFVRTSRRPRNAMAEAFISTEQIKDDETGAVLAGLIDMLRKDCERVIASDAA